MYCKNCGNHLENKANFCPVCGSLQKTENSKQKKTIEKWYGIGIIITLLIVLTFLCSLNRDTESAVHNNSNTDIASDNETPHSAESNTITNTEIKIKLQKAVTIAQNYLKEKYVGDLIGTSLSFGEVQYSPKDAETYLANFLVERHDEFGGEYDGYVYYVELLLYEDYFMVGSENQELLQYFGEAYKVTLDYDGCFDYTGKEMSIETSDTVTNNSNIYPEESGTTVELLNGMKVILPANWAEKFIVSNGAMYDSFFEKKNHLESNSTADGYLFGIWKICSCEELNYYPDSKVLGVYNDSGTTVGLIIDYPSDVCWDTENEDLASEYERLCNTMDAIEFDFSNLDGFIPCDENSISQYLP